jgi:hypothetical protein
MSARLDPTTGVVTDLAPLGSLGGVSEGFAAYDHLTKHLYELGDSLYTIDAVTGALLDAVPLSTDVINPVVNSAGQLFVLDYDTFYTAIVDPTTGAVTDLAPFQAPDIAETFRGYDPLTNRVYQFGDTVYAFNGTSGAQLFSTMEAPAAGLGGLYNPGVNGTGQILGIDLGGSTPQIARLDPLTGAITDLAPVPPSATFAEGMYAFDPCANLMYQLGLSTLLTVDGATGATVSIVTVSNDFLDFVAAW